ncbi:branched-chain-amino-acid aminotransferase-like protein 2 [Anneissia japonica]|uniref:branched-chain-amino-acid aminotransferase-like protein 2 n=1 Tax=Anneissia japonica TaxID=1529436 RepID=UPI0014255340|nr:branched-chain-amino-acid aminotransferase-like protein 2 [Anneissia japonica]
MTERRQVRIALWITPRSLSTAFLKCMSTFENAELFQEPYFTANMFGPERGKNIPQLEPLIECLDDVQHVTFEWVKNTLEKEYPGRDLVFMKDGARAIYGHFDSIPQGYQHVFLIRKPSKVHVSVDKIKDRAQGFGVDKSSFSTKDPTFLQGSPHRNVLELLEYVRDEMGQKPIVIDADDLMVSPDKIMKAFCEAVGLEYKESMLKWNPGPDPRWQRAKSVQSLFAASTSAHDNAYTSTGFQIRDQNTETETPLSEFSDEVRKMVEDSMPYYEKLAAMAIKLDDN